MDLDIYSVFDSQSNKCLSLICLRKSLSLECFNILVLQIVHSTLFCVVFAFLLTTDTLGHTSLSLFWSFPCLFKQVREFFFLPLITCWNRPIFIRSVKGVTCLCNVVLFAQFWYYLWSCNYWKYGAMMDLYRGTIGGASEPDFWNSDWSCHVGVVSWHDEDFNEHVIWHNGPVIWHDGSVTKVLLQKCCYIWYLIIYGCF